MKRYLAFLLVAVMVLSLCACGADNEPADQTTAPSAFGSEPTNGTSEPETPTDAPTTPTPDAPTVPSEDNTDDNSDPTVPSEPSEDVEVPPITEPDEDENQDDEVTPPEPTKPTNPTKPTEPKPTVPAEPQPTTPTVPTTPTKPSEPSEPTVSSKPTEPTPTVPTPPDEEDEPVVEEPYFVKMELVSVERPNAHYIDGVDMLTYMFGKNKALQKGDSVTYRIVMSDGSNEGFAIGKTYGFSATLDGNLLTITATGTAQSGAWVSIRSVNESGEPISKSVEWDYVIKDDGNLFENDGKMAHLLKRYAKFLGFTVKNGAQMTGYTTNTGGTMESLTGCTIRGNDDRIAIPGNEDWIEEVIWLFKEYKKLGFQNISFTLLYANSYHGCAD